MLLSTEHLLMVLAAVFLAGVIDAIAGGGGLISLPAYLAAGLPPHLALGTNKLSACPGTAVATLRLWRHGWVDIRAGALCAAGALLGASVGSATVLVVDPRFLKIFIAGAIPAAAWFVLRRRHLGQSNLAYALPLRRRLLLSSALGVGCGFYDGFFGPGTGTLLILGFTTLLRYDFTTANGNAKVVNLLTNIAALTTFVLHHQVLWPLGLQAAAASIAGNLTGAALVIRRGVTLVRAVFLLVLLLLLARITLDLWHG